MQFFVIETGRIGSCWMYQAIQAAADEIGPMSTMYLEFKGD